MATIKKRIEELERVQQACKDSTLPLVVPDNVSDEGMEVLALATGRKVYRFSESVELFT